MKAIKLLVLWALVILSQSGCSDDKRDYYSEVIKDCNYMVKGEIVYGLEPPAAQLRARCKTALETILSDRYDETWGDAPPLLKDKVTEAFQALVAYPLAFPPENRIFGLAPYSIPLSFIESATYYERNPMQSLFNKAFWNIDRITRIPSFPRSSAQWTPDFWHGGLQLIDGVLTIADSFGDYDKNEFYTSPVIRASILVHETRHGDGIWHEPCKDTGIRECDADFNGPYGHAISYMAMLLEAGGRAQFNGSAPLLSSYDIMKLGERMCATLANKFWHIPEELERFTNFYDCDTLTSEQVKNLAGLLR